MARMQYTEVDSRATDFMWHVCFDWRHSKNWRTHACSPHTSVNLDLSCTVVVIYLLLYEIPYNRKFSKWFLKVLRIVKHFRKYFFKMLSFMVMCSFRFHEFSKISFKIILASYFRKFNLSKFSAIRYKFCKFKFWWDSSCLSNNKSPI